MKKIIKLLLSNFYHYSGFNYLKRKLNLDSIVILTYHGVLPENRFNQTNFLFEYRNVVTQENFDLQMAYLSRHFIPISVNELSNLNKNDAKKPFIMITFDDGFENNYLYAFPVLKKYGIPGHFFITTNFIGSRNLLWTEEVNFRLFRTQKKELELFIKGESVHFDLTKLCEREKASIRLRQILKKEKRSTIEKAIEELRDLTSDVDITKLPKERYQFLNWAQIQEMHQNGMIIGSHTTNHFLLNNLNDLEVKETLKESKNEIEKHLQTECETFSYPNGERGNFSESHFAILKDLGYKYAFTQLVGFNHVSDLSKNRYALYRFNISYFMKMPIFKAVIAGNWKR